MREAKLVGLSRDGKQVILAVVETGEEFAVTVDDRLRAALRGDRARLGQLEIQMESALRPRDIQARIRSGESPEAVAQVAQMPVERIMAFAGPVLAERDHIATLAQRASVRRRGGDGPTRNLGTWVTERLRTREVDPSTAEWDAWRREDGRWAVRVAYTSGTDERTAMFAYDAPGRYAVPDDDEARWLVGEQPPAQEPAPPRERRLAAVDDGFDVAPDHGADSYAAGFEDALTLARESEPEPTRGPRAVPAARQAPVEDEPNLLSEVAAAEQDEERRRPRPQVVPSPPEVDADEPTIEIRSSTPEPAAEKAEPESADEAPVPDQPKKRPARRGQKRASVPSWDEIMFGKKAD